MTKMNIAAFATLAAVLSVAATPVLAAGKQPMKRIHHRQQIESSERSTAQRDFAWSRSEASAPYRGPGGRSWTGIGTPSGVDDAEAMMVVPAQSGYRGPGGRSWPGTRHYDTAGAVGNRIVAGAPFESDPFAYGSYGSSYAALPGDYGVASFNGDYYGGDNYFGAGYNGGRFSTVYASRNGFTCDPGTTFTGEDGLRHVCR